MIESEYKLVSSMNREELDAYGIKEVRVSIDCDTSKRTYTPIYK